MSGQSAELDALKDIPGYKAILKSVLKSQIQLLIEQLSNQTGEETIILTASVNDGTLSHLGSCTGKGFLEGRDEIKSQFLGYCLKTHHRKKTQETRSPYQRSNIGAPRSSPQHSSPKRPRIHTMPPQRPDPVAAYRSQSEGDMLHHELDSGGYSGQDPGNTGHGEGMVKREGGDSGEPSQDSYSLSETVSFPDSIKRSHTQTSADSGNGEGDTLGDRQAEESNDSASIKIEPITENEMELEITGVEPGTVPVSGGDTWSEGDMSFGAGGGDALGQGSDQGDYRLISPYLGRSYPRHQLKMPLSPAVNLPRNNSSVSLPVGPAVSLPRNNSSVSLPVGPAVSLPVGPAVNLSLNSSMSVKGHVCPYCGKVAGSTCDLKRHIRKHTGEKPYKCDICGKAFTRNEILTGHKASVHAVF